MRRFFQSVAVVGVVVGLLVPLEAQVGQASGKTLASTMDVYVVPTEGQAPDQQSKDEVECYQWAVQNTGSDPFDLSKQAEQQQQQAAAAQEQAKSAGKGAAYGAAAGVIRGRRRGRTEQQQAEQSAEQQAAQAKAATEGQLTNFKKAFAVCLEAKKYMVKF